MTSHSGRLVMVYNGEIYNNKDVKQKLIADGFAADSDFRGSSDTEVLLEAIEYYGAKEALSMCKGMFGIAVYDTKEGTVTLARDRVGEKPLYYGNVAGALGFASDLGCIRVVDGFDNEINTDVLDIYFTEGYIPAPYTIYKGINKLEAGTLLTIDIDTLKTTETVYWSMKETAKKGQDNPFKGSRQEASMEI